MISMVWSSEIALTMSVPLSSPHLMWVPSLFLNMLDPSLISIVGENASSIRVMNLVETLRHSSGVNILGAATASSSGFFFRRRLRTGAARPRGLETTRRVATLLARRIINILAGSYCEERKKLKSVEKRGFEPRTYRMLSGRSTPEPHPHVRWSSQCFLHVDGRPTFIYTKRSSQEGLVEHICNGGSTLRFLFLNIT